MMIRILKYLFWGISWGCIVFVMTNVIGVLTAGNDFLIPVMEHYLQNVAGAVIVGICCGSSSIIYTFKKIAFWKQICFHFIVGLTGYFVVAFNLGWIPIQSSLYTAISVLIGLLFFFVIWTAFYFWNKWEARKMNERLRELEAESSIPPLP